MGKGKEKDLQGIINTIELSEEQGEAITSYIAEYINTWKGQIETKIRSETEKSLTEEYNNRAKIFEGRLRKALTDEISTLLTKELSESITAAKETEMNEKLQEALGVASEYYATKFAASVQEAIAEIEKGLLEERSASPEVRTFRQIVGAVQPFVDTVDNAKLIEILESQDKTIKLLNTKLESLNKEKTIAECLAETPEAHKTSVRNFLEQAGSAEEVINKFEQAFEFISNTKDILEGKLPDSDELDLSLINEGRKPKDVDVDEDVAGELSGLAEDDELTGDDEDDDFFPEDDDDDKINESILEDDYFADKLETAAPLNEGSDEDKNEADAKPQQSKNELLERIKYMADISGVNS